MRSQNKTQDNIVEGLKTAAVPLRNER